MKTLRLIPSAYAKPVVWEPMGQSPGNTPTAKIQYVQTLLPFIADPNAGINTYELVKTLIQNGPLENAKGIQYTKEEIEAKQLAEQQAQAAAAMAANGGPGPAGPTGGISGGPVNPLDALGAGGGGPQALQNIGPPGATGGPL